MGTSRPLSSRHRLQAFLPSNEIQRTRVQIEKAVSLGAAGLKVLVAQSCLTVCDPRDCSPPGSSVRGILQARIPEWVVIPLLQGIFPTQGLNPGLLRCRQMLYRLSYKGSPRLGGCRFQWMDGHLSTW